MNLSILSNGVLAPLHQVIISFSNVINLNGITKYHIEPRFLWMRLSYLDLLYSKLHRAILFHYLIWALCRKIPKLTFTWICIFLYRGHQKMFIFSYAVLAPTYKVIMSLISKKRYRTFRMITFCLFFLFLLQYLCFDALFSYQLSPYSEWLLVFLFVHLIFFLFHL